MARRGGHPSDSIFKKHSVPKDELTTNDLLAVLQAVEGVLDRVVQIGEVLRLPRSAVQGIVKSHQYNSNRRAIGIIDVWLRGNFNRDKKPYISHDEEKHRCPSWWNLVWAVADTTGGANPLHARKIAQSYQEWLKDGSSREDFKNVDNQRFAQADCMDITGDLKEVWPKWYEVGVALRMPVSLLDNIQLQNLGGVEKQLSEMIRSWITQSEEEEDDGDANGGDAEKRPSWRTLLVAVAAEYGGQNPALANRLASKYTVSENVTTTKTSTTTTATESLPSPTVKTQKPRVPYDIDNKTSRGEEVTVGSGIFLERFQALESAKKATSIEFSFGKVVTKQGPKTNLGSYKMDKFPHGICVIINNEYFDHHRERSGTSIDEQNLVQCFRCLGYTVEVHRDCTAQQIEEIFSYYQKIDSTNFDSMVVCILSHGEEGHVIGTDSKNVELKISATKLNAKLCPSLAGKPKMFFIQACRGLGRSSSAYIRADSCNTEFTPVPRSSEAVGIPSSSITIPDDTDFFFGYATPLGKVSWRDENHGSWYISELCRFFCTYGSYVDLAAMITMVQEKVGTGYRNSDFKQAPEMINRLRKQVYF